MKKYVNTYSKKITSQPSTTIFSINPETNQPYMTPTHAHKLAWTHVRNYANNIPEKYAREDLVQECLLAVCKATFNPNMGASAKTFALLCYRHQMARVVQMSKQKGKPLEVPDFFLLGNEDEGFASEILSVQNITPEDYILARERAVELSKIRKEIGRNAALPGYKKPKRKQYIGTIKKQKEYGVRPDGTKKCIKCDKLLHGSFFGRNVAAYDGRSPYCKPCNNHDWKLHHRRKQHAKKKELERLAKEKNNE